MVRITLKPTEVSDLERLFIFQLDEEGRHLAAFTSEDSKDKGAYLRKYTELLREPTIHMRTIIVDHNIIVGSIAKFEMAGDAEITYWIDRRFWGRGIATSALEKFLALENTRPVFGR
ncbi:MAG TPA: GNAT family N-acetyltransferase, partial [Candidatus Babeliaceae bacterium]|nr:GNAT family N-acetyltransferase [Candidatus Babeliaceae bacterium]